MKLDDGDDDVSASLHTFLPCQMPYYVQQFLSFKGKSAPVGRWLWDNSKLSFICVFCFFLLEGVPVLHQNIRFHPYKGK